MTLRPDAFTPARARIGIVAGSSPLGGMHLWSSTLQEARTLLGSHFRGDLDAPEVTALSNPRLGLSMDMARYEERVRDELIGTVETLDALTDCFAIACSDLHRFTPEIRRLPISSRFFSMVDATMRHLQALGHLRIAVLGSKTVMTPGPQSPYESLFQQFDCEDVADPQRIHSLVHQIKRAGDGGAVRTEFDRILASIKAPVVVLACAELAFVARVTAPVILVDPTTVLARELVRWAYGRHLGHAAPDDARSWPQPQMGRS